MAEQDAVFEVSLVPLEIKLTMFNQTFTNIAQALTARTAWQNATRGKPARYVSVFQRQRAETRAACDGGRRAVPTPVMHNDLEEGRGARPRESPLVLTYSREEESAADRSPLHRPVSCAGWFLGSGRE